MVDLHLINGCKKSFPPFKMRYVYETGRIMKTAMNWECGEKSSGTPPVWMLLCDDCRRKWGVEW